MELIKTNVDLCTGCNRCVRECPMEPANITYQDDVGKIKVRIDHEKCIACGWCLTACSHGARYYVDDTERFFEDLENGVPISLIAAPAIRTNIPDWERLFTYLKRLGIKKIYDVSLGADICIWAQIRYIEKIGYTPVITQPCPAIVSFCEMYRQDLLKYLSCSQSPMASLCVYMKEYEGITDSIAALSPCVAKGNEFEGTGLAQYNITFARLLEYLEENGISLPEEKTGFDHDESGLGAVFPMPGGLRENIEFFMGKKLSIDKAEGKTVYDTLALYADSPAESLPHVFDVLNCHDGCNLGTACSKSLNLFRINREMDNRRKATTGDRKREYFDDLYKRYDETFDLSRFIREYKPCPVQLPELSDDDIEKAFLMLDKTDFEKKTIDCGACGSDTCLGMARKIALGVNIPINCIVKTMEDAKTEHEIYLETHYKLTEMEKIHETDELMRTMLETNPLGANFWNKDLEIIEVNEATIQLFGVSTKKEYIDNFMMFSPEYQPDGRLSSEAAMGHIRKAFDNGYERCEWTHQNAEGEMIPCEITMVRVEYKGEQMVTAYVRDLREQRRMIREIEEAQFTASAMFEANPHVNILFNSAFKMIDCNPAGIGLMGFNTKEDMLTKFAELMKSSIPPFQPDGRPSVPLAQRLMTAVKEGFSKFETEMVVRGYRKSLSVEFKRIPYANSFAIVGYIFDMTDIREREEELIRARGQNELQLATLNLVVKATKIGLWEMKVVQSDPLNPDNEFIWSDELRHMLGFNDENDFPNITRSWIERLHPDDKKRTLEAFEKHLFDLTGKTPYDIEYRLKRKNDEYVYYRATGETIRDDLGGPIRAAGSLLDITETKNILLDTEKQKFQAEAANQAKSAFLSTMSHEIRTPMNAILGITEIQLQNDSLDKSVREGLEKIYTSSDMLLGIINDILDLSKIEAGKLELFISNYEVASLISDTAQLNIMRIGSKRIEFELDVDENTPSILAGDELRVKQILNNILSNAFKYTEMGTVKMSMSATPIAGDDEMVTLIISIADTGQGMSKEEVNKLFDEYSRFNLETNRTSEGTGLGMSITRNLIHIMNGEITIESEPGKGSVFTVYLPQKKTSEAVLGKELAENLQEFRTSSQAQMRRVQISRDPMPYGSVLVVDDIESNIYVARGLLAPYDLKFDSANSGFAAIDKIEHGRKYDIIFMDHMMPVMDGVEATKRLRDMGYDQPIVALTANAVAGQADIFLENGFDDFISKPIDVRQLNSVLNTFIRDKQPPEVVEEARRKAISDREQSLEAAQQIDPRFAEIFIRDAKKSIAALEAVMEKDGVYSDDDIRTYIVHAHGIKSALANIGNLDLSNVARKLEQLGRDADHEEITVETPCFLDMLRDFVSELLPKEETSDAQADDEDTPFLTEKLMEIKAACEEYDDSIAEKALTDLRSKVWSQQTGDILEKISEKLLHSDFDEISEIISAYIEPGS